MRRRRDRWTAVISAAIVVGGLSWCGWRWWEVRRYRDAMARIEDAMQAARYAVAARDLSALLARSTNTDRTAYLLGVCEKARGRMREADAAWARVPVDSPFSGRAVTGRMDMLIEQGRLAEAEHFIERAAISARGIEGSGLRMLLIPSFMQEGREEEARRLIESRWRNLDANGQGASEQAINLARLHMELRWNVPPAGAVGEYLDQAGRLAPYDDRIWLGRANLANRAGSYDEAARWIDACLERRPDDLSVWRAKLDWAMRANRLDDVRTALKHLPAESASPADVHRLAAWLATACGDVDRERRELGAVVSEAPEDFAALERLEKLDPPKTATDGSKRRRSEIERAQARYRELYRRNQPARDGEEMARLARRLGHRFEAIAFLNAAIAEEPGRDDLRAVRHQMNEVEHDPPPEEGGSLFDRLRIESGGAWPALVSGPV